MTALRSVGRPRDPEVDRAVLEATRALLREKGYSGLRIGEVATRAGVTPPTVRLRWATKVELVHDAIFRGGRPRPIADTGSLEGDLRAVVRRTVTLYTTPEVRCSLLGFNEDLRNHPEMRTRLGARVYEPAVAGFREIIDRAVARGDIRAADAPHPALLMNTIAGAVIANVLLFPGISTRVLEAELVGLLLRGVGAQAESNVS